MTVVFVVSSLVGAAAVSPGEVLHVLVTQEAGETLSMLQDIRLPRELGALLVGAALSAAGALMQGMTRNPLADPSLLGLTAGANAA